MRPARQDFRDAKDAADIAARRRAVELAKRRMLAAAERDRAAKRRPNFVRCVAREWVCNAVGADTTRTFKQPASPVHLRGMEV